MLINILKNNEKYKIDILNSSFDSSLIDKISKLKKIKFYFIKNKNDNCLDIDQITNNDILPEKNIFYATFKECLNIKISTLINFKIDNYLYNKIEINLKNNIIKETKYMNNLYYIPTLNDNVYIFIYQ